VKGSGTSWAEPRELDLSGPQALPEGNHPGGNLVLFGDGSVRLLEQASLTPAKIRALATRSGGEPTEVAPEDFARLLEGLRAESFDSGKLSIVQGMSPADRFTSEQVRQQQSEFDVDSDRTTAAVALHRQVIDPQNFYRAFDAFQFESGYSAVVQKLALDRPAKPISEDPEGEAVSDQELKALVARLKGALPDAGKLAFLKIIVHGRFFTCDVAAELLSQFDFDSDREKAALAIYPRLSDPQNFYRVLTVFTFDAGRQSVRDKLELELK
jgi:hypothetical protein